MRSQSLSQSQNALRRSLARLAPRAGHGLLRRHHRRNGGRRPPGWAARANAVSSADEKVRLAVAFTEPCRFWRRDKGTVATVPLAGLETFPLRGARRATLRSPQLMFPRPTVGKCEVLAGLWPGTPGSAYRAFAARRSIRHSTGCVNPLPVLLTPRAECRTRLRLDGEVGSPPRGPGAARRAYRWFVG